MIRSALVIGDTHVPYHDPAVWSIACQIAKDLKPDVILHLGDLVDCFQVQDSFDKDPLRVNSLQDDIDEAAKLLVQLANASSKAELFLLEGNHEDRLRRAIWKLNNGQRELAKLRTFQSNVSWQALLKEAGAGHWQFVPMKGQAKKAILPMFITKHGGVVRKWSGQSAKAEWERYGRSGISGHTHRSGTFYTNDLNGAHVWIENGCSCSLEPEYTEDPNWQQGFTIITYTSKTNFSIEPVHVHKGVAVWRGKEYRG